MKCFGYEYSKLKKSFYDSFNYFFYLFCISDWEKRYMFVLKYLLLLSLSNASLMYNFTFTLYKISDYSKTTKVVTK